MSRMALKLECSRCGGELEVKVDRVVRFSGDVVAVCEELERALVAAWRDHLGPCARVAAVPLDDGDDIPW